MKLYQLKLTISLAAALLLMKRSKAIELGQPILAKYVGATVAGLAPRIMGIGPSVAIPKLLAKYNLTIDDCDIIEVNEAFASMAVYCQNKLNIPHEKMNIRGGAIALGHPLGGKSSIPSSRIVFLDGNGAAAATLRNRYHLGNGIA